MALLEKKIQASTLIEVITSMIIILIIFGISMMIVTNINTTSNTRMKLFAGMNINKLSEETKEEQSFFDEDYKIEGLKIEKKVSPYKNSENSILLEFIAFDVKGRKLATIREIIKTGDK